MNNIMNFNIDSFIDSTLTSIKNFLPWDYKIRLILFTMALTIVFGIMRLYEINKKDESITKE